MTYPHQQGPYGQQYGGHHQQQAPYGGPPPRKNNGAAVAVVIVLVAVLAGIGITGFVAPGFFLDDDKGSADGGGPGGGLPGAAGTVPPIGTPEGGGAPDVGDDPGVADGPDAGGGSDEGGGSGDSGGSGDAQVFAEEFLAAVNAKDEPTAEAMVCSDAPANSLVSYVIGKDPQLEIAGVEDAGSHIVDFALGGTVGGKAVTIGGVAVRVSGGGSPCVFTFNAG